MGHKLVSIIMKNGRKVRLYFDLRVAKSDLSAGLKNSGFGALELILVFERQHWTTVITDQGQRYFIPPDLNVFKNLEQTSR